MHAIREKLRININVARPRGQRIGVAIAKGAMESIVGRTQPRTVEFPYTMQLVKLALCNRTARTKSRPPALLLPVKVQLRCVPQIAPLP